MILASIINSLILIINLQSILYLFEDGFIDIERQPGYPNYEQISVEQGLPSKHINEITQDKQGFIWIATQSGLCRYDGFNIKVYKSTLKDSSSL